ncbi:protein of unknown function [Pararobbsia alpina]
MSWSLITCIGVDLPVRNGVCPVVLTGCECVAQPESPGATGRLAVSAAGLRRHYVGILSDLQ